MYSQAAGGLRWRRVDSVWGFVTVWPLCLRAYEHKGYCAAVCVQTPVCNVSLLISFSAGRIHRWLCFLSCLLLHYIMVTVVALIDGSVLSSENLEPFSCTHIPVCSYKRSECPSKCQVCFVVTRCWQEKKKNIGFLHIISFLNVKMFN